jgi:hypothetical protein
MEQQVADASAGEVGLKAMLAQSLDDRDGKIFGHDAWYFYVILTASDWEVQSRRLKGDVKLLV